ncbi:MAG: 50S ribosomal protein L18 [Candidatus Altiarchaeales archaeon ex4484_96]|nr:MAG: 50S ribosomal protein L18 [Candidatus Altiarchaeales archaeon ex4484_96]
MANTVSYTVEYRRKRSGKTDYKKRLSLLKSKKPRMVVRKSNKNIYIQLIEYNVEGDHVLVSASSKDLSSYGWKLAKSNIPSAYLTGYLCGRKCLKNKLDSAVVDLGLQPVVKSSRLFAAVKGAIDAGLDINAGESIFEKEERLRGEHIKTKEESNIADEMDKIKKKIDKKFK